MSFSRWIDKLVQTDNGILLSIKKKKKKKDELLSHEMTWKILKCSLLSESSQSEKAEYYVILSIWHSPKGKTMKTVKRGLPENKGVS